jgi:hypothetical protein
MGRPDTRQTMPVEQETEVITRLSTGETPEEIADAMNLDETVAGYTEERYRPLLQALKNNRPKRYDKARTQILTAVELLAIKSIVKGLHDTENPPALGASVLAFQALHKAGRLEKGQSTENIEEKISVEVDLASFQEISKDKDVTP